MVLNGGTPTIKIAKVDVDGNIGHWRTIDTPKEDSTAMETSAGDKNEWFAEGHELVDSYQKSATYTIKFDLFAKKGAKKPIEDTNGRITDNYAIMVIPEDPSCYGLFMPRCAVSCEETWTAAETSLWKYSFAALKSPDYVELMDYFVDAKLLKLSDNYVVFTATGGSDDAQTVTAEIGAGTTVSVNTADEDWISGIEVDGGTISITVNANTSDEKRSTFLTVKSNDGKSAKLKIIQAASEE